MRPDVLTPLFAKVESLPGIGPRLSALMARATGGDRVVDALLHLPTGLIDRRYRPKVLDAEPGRLATIAVEVVAHHPGPTKRAPVRVETRDATGTLVLVFFHAHGDWLARTLPVGGLRVVSGTLEVYRGTRQMTHPDYIVRADGEGLPLVEPVYPLTQGLGPRVLRRAVEGALRKLPVLPEWQDAALMRREGWSAFGDAMHHAHNPDQTDDLAPLAPARLRLAYDELLANQLALLLVRARGRKGAGRPVPAESDLARRGETALPFTLTGAQARALSDIRADMASGQRMMRLVQGDVGSGKTAVAWLAMLSVAATGGQCALMAPTEILARQHLQTLTGFARELGIEVRLLTGRDKGTVRRQTLEALASGEAQIVVGTHALFQEQVVFADLGLVVIDEQHRFGVDQRAQLTAKGHGVHLLVMTATPIPRTLMLTAYGDLDTSRITERPPGRLPIDTRAMPLARLDDMVEAAGRALAAGEQMYWICPLVEEDETAAITSVEERHRLLSGRFGGAVGLIHGRMKPDEKDAVMAAFSSGDLGLLVATTVVEVGVDVPNASIMVIEHAERFGLAQLHQLRGRVGRGGRKGTCILMYAPPLGEVASRRLDTMRRTDDGFVIAEEDLALRGAGEVLGTRQSGLPQFRLADLAVHDRLLAMARREAELIQTRDAELRGPRGEALRVLLYLFERDAAVRYLTSA